MRGFQAFPALTSARVGGPRCGTGGSHSRPAGKPGERESRRSRCGGGMGRARGPRGEPGEAGGCRERGRDLRAGELEAQAREAGEACAPERARGCEAETARPRAAERARPGDPPSRPRCGRTDGRRCVQEAPGHVQPELPEKTLQPLGECPPPERSRSLGPPGPRRAPCPASLRRAAAHLWPQVSRPRGRVRVRGARELWKTPKGLSPETLSGRERDPERWPCVSQCGGARESPLPRFFPQGRSEPQYLSSTVQPLGALAADLTLGCLYGCPVLPPSREHRHGPRRMRDGRFSGTLGNRKVLLLFLRNP